jgi:hypothetical protein
LGPELLRTLGQGQHGIEIDDELRFLKLLQAAVYHVCIAVNKEDIERTPPVSTGALGMETPLSSLEFVLGQI